MGQIHDLVRLRDVEGLEKLLREAQDVGALANEVDEDGTTPLFLAVDPDYADLRSARLLLEAGADVGFVRVQRIISTYRVSIVQNALKTANLEIIKLLASYGVDFHYTSREKYNAILDAAHAQHDPTEVVDYLLSLGVSPNAKSKYGELAVVVAMGSGRLRLVEKLLAAGADEAPLQWTPLIRAVTLGNVQDVQRELARNPDIEAMDDTKQTALHSALMRGDIEIVEALLAAGISVRRPNEAIATYLHCAMESGKAQLVLRMLEAGCPVDEKNKFGETTLAHAVAKGDHMMIRLLLEHGANPSTGDRFQSIMNDAKDRETILLLLEAGANPAELNGEGKRILVGLGEINDAALSTVTREQYMLARYEREGKANPEDITEPFRVAMIHTGGNAYRARKRFDDDKGFACGLSWKSRPPQVWCFERFGASFTLMPDGRTILIGGEHEDYYDPDFCIYNDVSVFHPDGEIRVFGYPYHVFEPTDFHTATHAGDFVWIIGGLGYKDEQRQGPIPVYKLDTRDYSIERVETFGDVPSRIYDHRASLVDGSIVIQQGTSIIYKRKKECYDRNTSVYKLELELRTWTRLSS